MRRRGQKRKREQDRFSTFRDLLPAKKYQELTVFQCYCKTHLERLFHSVPAMIRQNDRNHVGISLYTKEKETKRQ